MYSALAPYILQFILFHYETHFPHTPLPFLRVELLNSELSMDFGLHRYHHYFHFLPFYGLSLEFSQTLCIAPLSLAILSLVAFSFFAASHFCLSTLFYPCALASLARSGSSLKPCDSAPFERSNSFPSVKRNHSVFYHEIHAYTRNHADASLSLPVGSSAVWRSA